MTLFRNFFKLSFSPLLAAGLMSAAQAESLKVSIVQNDNVIEASSARPSSSEPWYKAASNDTMVRTSTRGEGMLSMMNKDETKEDRTVVGKEIPGHDLTRFEKAADGNIYMLRDYSAQIAVPNSAPITIAKNYRVPVIFKQGTWDDYLAGRKVQIEMSEEGRRIQTDLFAKTFQEVFANLQRDFASSGVSVSGLAIDKVESTSGIIELDQTTLVDRGSTYHIESSFRVNIGH